MEKADWHVNWKCARDWSVQKQQRHDARSCREKKDVTLRLRLTRYGAPITRFVLRYKCNLRRTGPFVKGNNGIPFWNTTK